MLSKKAFTICRHAEFISASSRLIKKGFTLIELLVVVLIIGILAAVAVPQYKFAVAKSRLAPGLSLLANIKEAEELYYLEHGSYTKNPNDLSIGFTGCRVSSKYVICPNFLIELGYYNDAGSANINDCVNSTGWTDCSSKRNMQYRIKFAHSDHTTACNKFNALGTMLCNFITR